VCNDHVLQARCSDVDGQGGQFRDVGENGRAERWVDLGRRRRGRGGWDWVLYAVRTSASGHHKVKNVNVLSASLREQGAARFTEAS
jgi:hypothetical protein